MALQQEGGLGIQELYQHAQIGAVAGKMIRAKGCFGIFLNHLEQIPPLPGGQIHLSAAHIGIFLGDTVGGGGGTHPGFRTAGRIHSRGNAPEPVDLPAAAGPHLIGHQLPGTGEDRQVSQLDFHEHFLAYRDFLTMFSTAVTQS